jgi:hypothetical protein
VKYRLRGLKTDLMLLRVSTKLIEIEKARHKHGASILKISDRNGATERNENL